MSKDWVEDVEAFHIKFLVPLPAKPTGMLDEDTEIRRMKLFVDEFKEQIEAIDNQDFVEYIDAIADMIYVLIGTALVCGVDLRPIWDRVHETNMAKIPPKNPGEKVQKPEGWEPPDIARELGNQGWLT
jgi:predicted HAD superfamily Cof-like phosphohydrolase